MSEQASLICRVQRWCVWSGQADRYRSEHQLPGGLWLSGDKPDVSFLPALQRRRLSTLARTAFAVAWPCLEDGGPVPVVCCSAHGEMARSVSLLGTLALDEPLSPMAFSLSVHNAIAGQLSIALDNRAPVLALAPGEEGLSAGVVEALGLLAEGERSVLVVWYDEPLPPPYDVFGVAEPVHGAALSMLLSTKGEGTPLTLTRVPERLESGAVDCPETLPVQLASMIDALGQGERAFTSRAHAARWHWRWGE